jgi:hypothetical protein
LFLAGKLSGNEESIKAQQAGHPAGNGAVWKKPTTQTPRHGENPRWFLPQIGAEKRRLITRHVEKHK